MGPHPAKALRLARDTGVLAELLSEFERAIGFDQGSKYHNLTLDEHTFQVVQAAADAHLPLRVRLAALFHDLGKPHVAWRGSDNRLHYYARPGYSTRSHEQVSAQLADEALERLRYPTDLRQCVVRIVRAHMIDPGKGDEVPASAFERYGVQLTFDLLDHKRVDLLGKGTRTRRSASACRRSGRSSNASRRARTGCVTLPWGRRPHRDRLQAGACDRSHIRALLDDVVRGRS
jgi:hypothetical protein